MSNRPKPNMPIRLPDVPVYQQFFDGRCTREIIKWLKRLAEREDMGLSEEDRAFLDLLKELLDLSGGTIDLQGFNVVIESDISNFPSTGNTFTLYIVDNDTGSLFYIWRDQYVLVMQSPNTIDIIKGGNAHG